MNTSKLFIFILVSPLLTILFFIIDNIQLEFGKLSLFLLFSFNITLTCLLIIKFSLSINFSFIISSCCCLCFNVLIIFPWPSCCVFLSFFDALFWLIIIFNFYFFFFILYISANSLDFDLLLFSLFFSLCFFNIFC